MNTLLENAKRDPNLFFITGDLGYGVVDNFQRELPRQFLNVGVTEQSMIGIAAGIASTGKRVFVYSIGNFPTLRCLEQIRNDVCLMNQSVVIVSVGAGYAYGSQGYTHHAIEDIAVMRALPNMKIYVPCDSNESSALTSFLSKTTGPAYLRLSKNGEPDLNNVVDEIKNSKPFLLKEGKDGTLIFIGPIGSVAFEAADSLSKMGIEISLVSMPQMSEFDPNFFEKIAKEGPIFTLEEHATPGGFGSFILEKLNEFGINAKVSILASNRSNLSKIGSQGFLQTFNGIGHDAIIQKILSALAK